LNQTPEAKSLLMFEILQSLLSLVNIKTPLGLCIFFNSIPIAIIRISKEFLPIGSEVGVLGYPLCKLEFQEKDINEPLIGNILLRADRGVMNCRYQTSETHYSYKFTLAFNPGNSGGPIFDVKTGRLISIVKGYKAIRINERENIIFDEGAKQLKIYTRGVDAT